MDLAVAPAGGITGTTRHSLDGVMRRYGLMGRKGQNMHLAAMGLYVDFAGIAAQRAWDALVAAGAEEESVEKRSWQTLEILKRELFLVGLAGVQVARYLELVYPRLFHGASCDFVGEFAARQLARIFNVETVPSQRGPEWKGRLRRASAMAVAEFPAFSKAELGAAGSQWAQSHHPIGIPSVGHFQLVEHVMCDTVKVKNPQGRESRDIKAPTPIDAYRAALNRSAPLLTSMRA